MTAALRRSVARQNLLLVATLAPSLLASPVWQAPDSLPFGDLTVIELKEADPAQPPLPRPGEERLGSLDLRGVEPTPDGRGWRLTVQPMVPGVARIPPIDLGDGRITPELQLRVPRTVPYQAPWVGIGGGQADVLPLIPFPWAWTSVLLVPLAALGYLAWRQWRKGATTRTLRQARRDFSRHWPPASSDRSALDEAHALGRNLLAIRFGDGVRSWGAPEFRAHGLETWGTWVESLDAARFARREPPFPPLEQLLGSLGDKP